MVQLFQIGFGGIPGRPLGDGFDGHSCGRSSPTFRTSIWRPLPLRIESLPDRSPTRAARASTGAATASGWATVPRTGLIAIHDDRWFTQPWGVTRRASRGARGEDHREADGSSQIVPANETRIAGRSPGDLLHFVTWGGGGWGDPLIAIPRWSLRRSAGTRHRRGRPSVRGGPGRRRRRPGAHPGAARRAGRRPAGAAPLQPGRHAGGTEGVLPRRDRAGPTTGTVPQPVAGGADGGPRTHRGHHAYPAPGRGGPGRWASGPRDRRRDRRRRRSRRWRRSCTTSPGR